MQFWLLWVCKFRICDKFRRPSAKPVALAWRFSGAEMLLARQASERKGVLERKPMALTVLRMDPRALMLCAA
jgi:hypothetical protein